MAEVKEEEEEEEGWEVEGEFCSKVEFSFFSRLEKGGVRADTGTDRQRYYEFIPAQRRSGCF